MGEILVVCGGAIPPKRRSSETFHLDLSGRRANICLRIEDISRRLVANIPNILSDLLEVATYVYCADQLMSRGGNKMQALASEWRRSFSFLIAVREAELWNRSEVCESLKRLLAFLSDEEYRFEFVAAETSSLISNPKDLDTTFCNSMPAYFQALPMSLRIIQHRLATMSLSPMTQPTRSH
jgi:hypothetical protein